MSAKRRIQRAQMALLISAICALAVQSVWVPVVAEADAGLPALSGAVHTVGAADMYPVDVTAANGRIYVVDPGRYRVAAVDLASGQVVGEVGGTKGGAIGKLSAARGIDNDSAGRIYVADSANNRVQVFSPTLEFLYTWGSRGSGAAQFTTVYDVTVGQGRLSDGSIGEVVYTTDGGRVQKFSTTGAFISVFATGLNQPRQMAVRPGTTDLFVINARDREIRIYGETGMLKGSIGAEGSDPGQFKGDPRGLAFTPDGSTLFVSDEGNRRIQAFDAVTLTYSYSISGFTDVRGLAVSGSTLVVADQWDHSLKLFDLDAAPPTLVGRLFGSAPPNAGVNSPRGLAVDDAGMLFTTDWWNQRIVRSDTSGGGNLSFGGRGTRTELGKLNFPWDIAVQPDTGRVFVANRESHEIEVFTGSGEPVTGWGRRGSDPGRFLFPNSLDFAPDGTLWVTDSGNGRLQQFQIDEAGVGTWLASYGTVGSGVGQLRSPIGLDVGSDGSVWVADQLNHRVQRLDPATATWTELPRPDSEPFTPKSVAVAPDGNVWVTDGGGNQVHIFTSSWQHLTAFRGQDIGAGGFLEPFDIAFDSDGTAFLSDLWNNRVLRLEASGGPAPDATGPQLELHAPEPRSTVDRPVVIAGSITDDRAVGSVQVAIRDRATGLWWDPIAQRWGSFVRSPAVLAAPGTSGSPFTYSFAGAATGGSYWLSVKGSDAAGNAEQAAIGAVFSVH